MLKIIIKFAQTDVHVDFHIHISLLMLLSVYFTAIRQAISKSLVAYYQKCKYTITFYIMYIIVYMCVYICCMMIEEPFRLYV